MNAPLSSSQNQNTGIGRPVPRKEDARLLQGQGRYSDDISLPGQAYAVMVRSAHAHGVIRGIDIEAAKAMPGVLGVYTGADLAEAGFGGLNFQLKIPGRDGSPTKTTPRFALATDHVRFLGDPVAFVVAESAIQARDAAEAVELDVDSLPAVVDLKSALAPDAPEIYAEVPGNLALDFHSGDTAAVDAAFAKAAHIARLDIANSRIVVNAMEPRAALGEYDPASERWTLHAGSQGAFPMRNQLAKDVLKVPNDKVRVLTGNVGGSFGMKAPIYPEYVCVLHAAKALGRPVKWTADRSESFLSDQHGRDHLVTGTLALDEDGKFLAVRFDLLANQGAYLSTVGPLMHTMNIVKNGVSLYRFPLIEVNSRCVLTNTAPIGPYRGAGRPEANYYVERLIDTAAREMGIDRAELRRRNHIRNDELPYLAASGMSYDSGDFTAVMDQVLELSDWQGFAARKAESETRGKLRGIGIGDYLEVTAPPSQEMGGLRFEPNGDVTIITGTLDYGQGHATPFAQVLSDRLGVPFDRIQLLQGDSDELIAGGGTGGSKSLMASGAAIIEAAQKVVEKGRELAASVLEAASVDIEFAEGRFTIAGTDRSISLMDLAGQAEPGALDVQHIFDNAPSAFPNGCHVAEVEIDPDTGVVEVVKYTAVNDFGTIVNPMMVEGQVHGGVAQGIGQALMENTIYDGDGQLLTGSYMDYAMPRADNMPDMVQDYHAVPATTNPLGAKGCGEAGCAGSLPSVMNAVVDALSVYGITHIDMPATPYRVWQAIREKQAA
ncbi:MAG: xanthine dehydrogenase family protein molybdopterin-binding subunit [Alphaproteobacteria bacterium]|nr:xanthine dehydrogenase family protein molybdopterin-binding subunit [Alphaproteobacteria bacterium]MBU0797732.1 xanthine dehydrogenase family protein molybdopterin-binding subunit [Alphaproteobacteria bacterium]MBU0887107.1 xanthine dehydrogenase family protein molybdopterin-binding subunit [Alphaproteobacteria bacterium]MBU1814357.1 xanthine dehydrogenase family protein molybdopterin-binding subunit [Alphaproteobacteria bacterium]